MEGQDFGDFGGGGIDPNIIFQSFFGGGGGGGGKLFQFSSSYNK